MSQHERFSYTHDGGETGEFGLRPWLPVKMTWQGRSLEANALLDTGSMVNVLPYQLGLALGLDWASMRVTLPPLAGNLAHYEVRAALLTAKIGNLVPVSLAFAWTKAEDVPLLFGHINFFTQFDVCFYRADKAFAVKLRSEAP